MKFEIPSSITTRCGVNCTSHTLDRSVPYVPGDLVSGRARYGPWYNRAADGPISSTDEPLVIVTEPQRQWAIQWLAWKGYDPFDQQSIEDIGIGWLGGQRYVSILHAEYIATHPLPTPEPVPEPTPEPTPEPEPIPEPPPFTHVASKLNCEDWLLDNQHLKIVDPDVVNSAFTLSPLFEKTGFVWMGKARRAHFNRMKNFIYNTIVWGH